MQFLIVGKGIN